MSFSDLQLPEAMQGFLDPLKEVRQSVEERMNAPINALEKSHLELESTERSPYLTSFEDFYRRKLALGKITLGEVFLKIDLAVRDRGITVEEAQHMKEHLVAKPPTMQDIQAAIEQEIQKQYREAEKAINDAIDEQRRIAQELELISKRREERRKVRQERRAFEVKNILQNRRITKEGRTLVFGKNGQLYVFRKGRVGRSKMSSYYKRLERLLRGMKAAAQETQGEGQV